MKNLFRICLSILFIFCILSIGTPLTVEAKSSSTDSETSGVAGGSWTGGENIDVSKEALSAPDWLQLMTTNGVDVTTPGKICHPFRGGQFGWVGQIRQLMENGTWKKLPTIVDWVPSREGKLIACAQAPEVGIYALFATFQESGSTD